MVAVAFFIGWLVGWPASLFGVPTRSGPAARVAATSTVSPAAQVPPAGQVSGSAVPEPGASTISRAPTTVGGPVVRGPAAVVEAYFGAINGHDYARAWRLGGKYVASSYAAFVSGFGQTARDMVTIEAISGDAVAARLVAVQADGSVKVYSGVYTVAGGQIVKFRVVEVS